MAKSDFHLFFQQVFADRWDLLAEALKKTSERVMRLSYPSLHLPFVPPQLLPVDYLNHAYFYQDKGQHYYSDKQLELFYVMDPASQLVASQLNVTPGMSVLDMCSAPGGKGLILAEKLEGRGEIILNEFSRDRRDRLVQVVRDYIPAEFRPIVFVRGKDAALYGLSHPNSFDAILLDAPCSGEQHLIQQEHQLEKWSTKRTKRLAQQQYSMLCSALLAAKNGAEIVYSTCSISPYENDLVIERLLEKKGDNFELLETDLEKYGAEKTKYGYIFLPDRSMKGPMYCCKLRVKK